jgi:hypothetical protein
VFCRNEEQEEEVFEEEDVMEEDIGQASYKEDFERSAAAGGIHESLPKSNYRARESIG